MSVCFGKGKVKGNCTGGEGHCPCGQRAKGQTETSCPCKKEGRGQRKQKAMCGAQAMCVQAMCVWGRQGELSKMCKLK